MSSLIPGVHVAMHTRAEILHTAAWMAFSNYVRALLQAGRVVEARRLWDTAQSIWTRYHVPEDTFELLALPRLASGVTREQLLPSHFCGVLDRLAMCRDVLTMEEVYQLWRTWQMGYCTWREPCAPTIAHEREQPSGASWAPWRLRRLGSWAMPTVPRCHGCRLWRRWDGESIGWHSTHSR